MRALQVGHVGKRPFTLPEESVTSTQAIVGLRGRGKTVTASVMVEELLKLHHQAVIIDPLDVWWGLKSSADGKRPAFPVVILGGWKADLPLSERAGPAIAEFAVRTRASMILSLRMMTKEKQIRFVMEFCETLFHLKGDPQNRTPLWLGIDECHRFAPQMVTKGGDGARCLGAVQDCFLLGRSSGFGGALIGQRPAMMNKNALSQVDTLITHGLVSKHDRDAIDGWIVENGTDEGKDRILPELPSLPMGTAFVWSPLLNILERVDIRMRETFDSSRTPKLGETIRPPDRVAAVDLDALRTQLDMAVKDAEQNDPKTLRATIAKLERQLAAAPAVQADDAALLEAHAQCGALEAELEKVSGKMVGAYMRGCADAFAAVTTAVQGLANDPPQRLPGDLAPLPAPLRASLAASRAKAPPPVAQASPARAQPVPRPPAARANGNGNGSGLRAGAVSILTIVAQQPRGAALDKTRLAVLAGYKRSSRNTYVSDLVRAGYVVDRDGMLSCTPEGIAYLGDFEPLPTGRALLEYHRERLGPGELAMLDAAVGFWPDAVERASLGEATSYARSARNTYISRLIARGLLEEAGRGMVRAADDLFDGRRRG